jgi:hypothetical protein
MKQLVRDSPNIVGNVQVTQIANAGAFARPANESDLERAVRIFCDMALPGAVELFTESLVAAEYFLKPAFPNLRLHCIPLNVSRSTQGSHSGDRIDDVEDRLIALWGKETCQELLRLNQLDLELYRRAQSEVQRRLFLLPDLNERMVDFEARCEKLRVQAARAREGQPIAAEVAVGAAG